MRKLITPIVVPGPKPVTIVGKNDWPSWSEEHVMILTGKRRKPQSMSYSAHKPGPEGSGDWLLNVQCLYSGSYGDGYVMATDLIKALERVAPKAAAKLKGLLVVWNTPVKSVSKTV